MKIALVGSEPSSTTLAPVHDASWDASRQGMAPNQFRLDPYVDETWEIWGVSPGAFAMLSHGGRASRWFELHRWEPGQPWFQPEYLQFLRDFRGPVYTGGVIPEIENHVVYPIERVEDQFSAYFLHSSLSLMMAVAILEIEDERAARRARHEAYLRLPTNVGAGPGYEPEPDDDIIGFWGVDMSADEEYGDQRSGCHFFILEALRRGIEVYVPPESCLLRPKPVYGLSEWNHDYIKSTAKMRLFNQRAQHYKKQLEEVTQNLHALSGAQSNLNYYINTWTNPYGLPAGVRIKVKPGTGLGGGITMPRPISVEPGALGGGGTPHPVTPDYAITDAVAAATGLVDARPRKPILYGGGAGGGKSEKMRRAAALKPTKKARPRAR